MLTQLHIENIAVIKKASIPLESGLNVFTGETGAGKTMLISALDAVLGERTSRDIIRTGEDKAVVTALFERISPRAKQAFEEMGYEIEDDSVLIFREMTTSGRNTCRINGMPANVSILKAVSSHLIHIHGQRDSEQILAPERHIEMIDDFGVLAPERGEYQVSYNRYKKLTEELASLSMDENQKAQRLDMLMFQKNEIELANLENPKEEDELQIRRKAILGSERIQQGFASAYGAWSGEEAAGLRELFGVFQDGIEEVARYIEEFSPMVDKVQEIFYDMQEYAADINRALEEFEFDPQELDQLEYRLNEIYKLKKKYGASIEEILLHYEEITKEYKTISTNETKQNELREAIKQEEKTLVTLGKALSSARLKAATSFLRRIEAELAFLDMPTVTLSLAHQLGQPTTNGLDTLEFLIVTNVGELPKPLSRIASGGEISRIMLAIKNVLADRDDIDTLIFDEVDTGVSGSAAGKIGRKLAEVSENRQVISVTHLAQVAAFSNNHLLISKETDESHTYTRVKTLSHEETIRELARITSGEIITDAALQSAGELWERAHAATKI